MKNLLKLKVILLVITFVLTSQVIAADRILPIPKPTPDQETKIKTAEKKYIYPKKKPTLKKEEIDITESKEVSETDEEIKEDVFVNTYYGAEYWFEKN